METAATAIVTSASFAVKLGDGPSMPPAIATSLPTPTQSPVPRRTVAETATTAATALAATSGARPGARGSRSFQVSPEYSLPTTLAATILAPTTPNAERVPATE